MIYTAYIDLETTGVNPVHSGLTQIAGVITNDKLEIMEGFNFKVRPFPEDVISDEALAVQHRTREEIASFLDPKEVYQSLVKILAKYCDKFNKKDKLFFSGYNAQFDNAFMRVWFEKNGDKYFGSWFWYPDIDIMRLAAEYLRPHRAELRDFKLGTVAEYLNVKIEGDLHGALTDINTSIEIYKLITKPK